MTDKEAHLSMYNAALNGILASNSVRKNGKSIEVAAMEIANRSLTLFKMRWEPIEKKYREEQERLASGPNPYTESQMV